jgi:hypothetical protein
MNNNSTITNNVNNEFTTTTTNAVEITPATLELAKLKGELDTLNAELNQFRQALQLSRDNITNRDETIAKSISAVIGQLDGCTIAEIIYELPADKVIDVVRALTNMNHSFVKQGVTDSVYSENFNSKIEDLDAYISEQYNEAEIVNLIDEKYSWSTLLNYAFRNNSLDSDDVADYIDTEEVVTEEFRKGNISFDDVMSHFDASDCFQWLDDASELNWDSVKDYVDLDAVKEEIVLDADMVETYINNLDNHSFRNLIANIS